MADETGADAPENAPKTREAGSARRFLIASVAALVIDMGLTLALREATGMSLTLSAALSFILVGAAFYFVHEYWTFRREGSRASGRRLAQNLGVLGAAFLGRVGTIGALESWREPELILGAVYFIIGAGVSFAVNYLANRFWVFRE